MLSASIPAIAKIKPDRSRRTTPNKHQPTKPTQPPAAPTKGKRATGIEINLDKYFTPKLPPLPDTLGTLLQKNQATGQVDKDQVLELATDFIFGAIGAGVSLNDIDQRLGLVVGTINGWSISTPENLTRTCFALVTAADNYDVLARKLLTDLGGHASSAQTRILLATANSARCQAEGWRRLSESLGRRSAALSDHNAEKKKAAEAKRQARAIAEKAKANKERRRKAHEETIKVMGGHAPGPDAASGIVTTSNLEPWTQEEHQYAMPFEQSEILELHEAGKHRELQMYVGKIRDRWRAEQGTTTQSNN